MSLIGLKLIPKQLDRDVHVVLVSLFGRPIVPSIFHFSGVSQKNCPVFFENWPPSNQRLDKKVNKVDKRKFSGLAYSV